MLRTRVLTALVLLPAAFALIFLASPWQFAIAAAVVLLIGAWEFIPIAGLARGKPSDVGIDAGTRTWGVLLVLLQLGIMAALWAWMSPMSPARTITVPAIAMGPSQALATSLFFCALWTLVFLRLRWNHLDTGVTPAFKAISVATALLVITAGWFALVALKQRPNGDWLITYLVLIIVAADVGAYFSGRAFGKKKLAPRISPGKTRAGLYGGLLCAVVVAEVAAWLMADVLPPRVHPGPALAAMAAVVALVSVGGDLLISLHKRITGVKDSGKLFPGHGGVLDRLDSLLAAAPFYYAGILLLGPQ